MGRDYPHLLLSPFPLWRREAVGDPLSHNITHLLNEWSDGDRLALDELTPLVYEELRHQAARYLRRERPGRTLQTTALINEAYLRLIDAKDVQWRAAPTSLLSRPT